MQRNWKTNLASLAALCLLTSVSVFGQETKVQGMISGRTGETLIVNTSQGKVTVVLAGDTRVKDNTGMFGLDRQEMAPTVLIPGLKVSVEGTSGSGGRVMAKSITVDGDDLESSQMIEAGLQPTADQVLEHEKQLLAHQKAIGANKESIAAIEA